MLRLAPKSFQGLSPIKKQEKGPIPAERWMDRNGPGMTEMMEFADGGCQNTSSVRKEEE